MGRFQPPSGGCVLKRHLVQRPLIDIGPAAFGRLCVETTASLLLIAAYGGPAAFGRLCVETTARIMPGSNSGPAAFGRLCVETLTGVKYFVDIAQPPSGGCVLKHPMKRITACAITSRLRAAVC